MPIRKLQARLPWLGDERSRAEGLPRFHLLYPSFRALAREMDAAFEWQLGGIAARLASVLMHAVDEDPTDTTPLTFRGSWETDAFTTLLRNAVAWGVGD